MQKVKFEAPTGAELRQQMLDFLGLNGIIDMPINVTVDTKRQEALAETATTIKELAKDPEPSAETQAPETTTTRKRRTKAEIEAEKAPETPVEKTEEELNAEATGSESTDDAPADDTGTADTLAQDNAEANKAPEITKEMLTPIVLELGRAGKKASVVSLLSQYKQADGTTAVGGLPTLQVSDYADFHSKLILI